MPVIHSQHAEDERVKNSLKPVRERAGISAAQLAKSVRLSRQAIYAIEAGSYVPNTAVSLRLARALDVDVTELFHLPEASADKPLVRLEAALLAGAARVEKGRVLRLWRVDGRLIAAPVTDSGCYLPSSDAVAERSGGRPGKVSLSLHDIDADFENRLLIAGCDPAMSILAQHLEAAGIRCALIHRNSSESLKLLKQRQIHIAGTHLSDFAGGEANLAAARRILGRTRIAVISFAQWQQGLIVSPGNPKRIKAITDLARKNVRFANREAGSGTRLLIETHLRRLGIPADHINVWGHVAHSHLAAAREVLEGRADCCVAPEAAARLFGLPLLPLAEERYDFVIRRSDLKHPGVERLFDIVSRAKLRRELGSVGGYKMSIAGNRVA